MAVNDDFIGAGDDFLDGPPAAKTRGQKTDPGIREYAIIWIPVYCPGCGAKNKNVYNSSAAADGIRYHKCGRCGTRFKSIEHMPPEVKRLREGWGNKN